MRLFQLENNVVTFSPQALLIEPFKVLWERDKSKDKARALNELSFIWYMEDVRSDFFDIIDEDKRRVEVLKYLTELPSDYQPDKEVQDARKTYQELSETMSVKILKDTMKMVNNLRASMVTMDFTKMNNSGNLVHDPNKAADLAGRMPKLVKDLKDIYREIEKEADEESAMRGSKIKTFFEEGM